jgi:hydrogenase expression/formation protein HypC
MRGMCLAVPGKIVEKKGDRVVVDYGSERREARIVEGDYNLGDFVVVQAMVVSERVSEEQMKGWLSLVDGIENVRVGG